MNGSKGSYDPNNRGKGLTDYRREEEEEVEEEEQVLRKSDSAGIVFIEFNSSVFVYLSPANSAK